MRRPPSLDGLARGPRRRSGCPTTSRPCACSAGAPSPRDVADTTAGTVGVPSATHAPPESSRSTSSAHRCSRCDAATCASRCSRGPSSRCRPRRPRSSSPRRSARPCASSTRCSTRYAPLPNDSLMSRPMTRDRAPRRHPAARRRTFGRPGQPHAEGARRCRDLLLARLDRLDRLAAKRLAAVGDAGHFRATRHRCAAHHGCRALRRGARGACARISPPPRPSIPPCSSPP